MTAARLRLDDVNTLLVDGDAFQLNLLADMLRGLGLTRITLAETGAEAQDHFQQDSFDLCICESRLPDLGGAELVRWVRRLPPPARFVPLLVVTGYSEFRDVTSLRDAGAHLVLHHSVSPTPTAFRSTSRRGIGRLFIFPVASFLLLLLLLLLAVFSRLVPASVFHGVIRPLDALSRRLSFDSIILVPPLVILVVVTFRSSPVRLMPLIPNTRRRHRSNDRAPPSLAATATAILA